MIYNYYNRISTTKLISKSRLNNNSRAVSKMSGSSMDRELDDDELYDDTQDVMNDDTHDMNVDEKYDYIRKQVDLNNELKDTIEKLCDNAIVPDTSGRFYELGVSGVSESIEKTIIESDKKVLSLLGFDNHIEAWSRFFEWSCYGKLAYRIKFQYRKKSEIEKEIEKTKEHLKLVDIDLNKDKTNRKKLFESKNASIKKIKLLESVKYKTIMTGYDKENEKAEYDSVVVVGIDSIKKLNVIYLKEGRYDDNPKRKIWQYKQNYYDQDEIIVVDYNYIDGNNLPKSRMTMVYNRKISYADSIIRDFNIMNRIEISIVAWTILNSMYRQKMVVPIMTKVSHKAKMAISKIRNKYMDNFEVDNNGIVRINGESSFNYMNNIVVAERNGRKPEVDTVKFSGWDLKNMDIVDYFRENFIRSSKIPSSRYNKGGNVGQLSLYKADGVPYDEINFYNYLDRVLHQFSNLIKQPTLALVYIKHPESILDKGIKNKIKYRWESFSHYIEAKEAEKNTKVLSNIDQMTRFTGADREPAFDLEYLFVKRFNFMTQEEWNENESIKNSKKANDSEL